MENKENSLTLDEIKKCLPHRYPMLLVDKIESYTLGEVAVGVKNVTANEPFFQGHFPAKEIMPGVLIIEAMGQTAGVLVSKTMNFEGSGDLVYFMSIENAKFRKLVVPGDVLKLKVTKERSRGNVWRFSGEAFVEDVLVAEASFSAMIVKDQQNG